MRSNTEAVTELRREFVRRGWDKKATRRIVFELAIHALLGVAGIVIFMAFHNVAARVMGLLISAFGCMGVGTNSHTSSHYGTSNKRWLNEALTYLGFPMFDGLSATYWWHKHVVLHHPAPNTVGVDTDSDLLPWFVMTMDDFYNCSGARRFYHEYVQFWVFPLVLAINCFNIQKDGWVFLIKKLFNSKERKASHFYDLTAMVAHYVLWIGLPMLIWPAGTVVAFYLLRNVLLGYAMYAVLAPGHFPAEAIRTTEEARKSVDFFTLQAASTVSFRTGWLGRFLCSGLDYQVEHHMFPNISHVYYRQMSGPVQDLCREQGLPYHSYTWGTALLKSWAVLRNPQPVLRPGEVVVCLGKDTEVDTEMAHHQ